ncbi:8-amino-7-oxononanoate synthase [Vibrio sinaloensis]|nr:8-amino-7-oxononanoate synthase [Vibrio sinaloensis]
MICSTMPAFKARIKRELQRRQELGLSRQVKEVNFGNCPVLEHGGETFLNFSSNDYLGLACDDELRRAWQKGLEIYGCGSGASPLVTGFSSAHAGLKFALCEWLGFESAVLFGSGFAANQALIFGLLEKGDLLLQDKLNHASLMEAGMLSPATMKRFKHNDVASLKALLTDDAFVITEGVFSMDGDLSPLADIRAVVKEDSLLAVDDAHGIGVLGSEGQGSCHLAQITPDVLVVTFGKAFGLSGAVILCSAEMGDYLTQFARHHVYSTAIPPSQAYALTHAVTMLQTQHWRREKLAELQHSFKENFSRFPGYVETATAIKPVLLGDSHFAVEVSQALKSKGLWTTAIRPPTVPQGTARLRITLTANHELSHVVSLAENLEQLLENGSIG